MPSDARDEAGQPARVCVVSIRDIKPEIARCNSFEFEDVIAEIDAVDLHVPQPAEVRPPSRMATKLRSGLRKGTGLTVSSEPGVVPSALERDYDLLFVVVQQAKDLRWLASIDGWRDRCAAAVCWIEECWIDGLKWRKLLEPLRHFDHVLLGCSGTIEPLAKLIAPPCRYGPPGIDAIRFGPYPDPPARSLDVYLMGRRSAETHAAFLRLAEQGRIHYMFDSIHGRTVSSPREHRLLLASLVKRSRYFVAYRAKVNRRVDTAGQEEVGLRFFEGAAGGAVMLGEAPRCATFPELFDWPDAVIPMPFGTTEVEGLLRELDGQPERLANARRNNVVNSLLRHDWAYRWGLVLEAVGLPPLPQLARRQAALRELAEMAEGDAAASLEREGRHGAP